jgi:hypothetical protein
MTESEWLCCTDPKPMLEFLKGKASDRKLRLFCCACCKRIWHLLTDVRSRSVVNAMERYADGLVKDAVLSRSHSVAQAAYDNYLDRFVHRLVLHITEPKAEDAAWKCAYHRGPQEWYKVERVLLLHDIFGNPFQPITPDPSWLTPNVTALAQSIYDNRSFDRLPALTDALEEAGCTNADILSHSRWPGPHVRGCWALDFVLGKE